MTKSQNSKQYDLEKRTLEFAGHTIEFGKGLPKTIVEGEIAKQLVRAATSVGANYIEANESGYWLRIIEVNTPDPRKEQEVLLNESIELTEIFDLILTKSQ